MVPFVTAYEKVCFGPVGPWEETQQRFRNLPKEDAQAILRGYLNKELVLGWVMQALVENSPWLTREDLQKVLDNPELDSYSHESLTSDQVAQLLVAGKKVGPILRIAEKRLIDLEDTPFLML